MLELSVLSLGTLVETETNSERSDRRWWQKATLKYSNYKTGNRNGYGARKRGFETLETAGRQERVYYYQKDFSAIQIILFSHDNQ